MDDQNSPNRDPGGEKLKAWLLTGFDGKRVDLKEESGRMVREGLMDTVRQFVFAAKMGLLGGALGGLVSYFIEFPMILGAGVTAVVLGGLAFVSWMPGSRL